MKVSFGGQGRIEGFEPFVFEGRKVVQKTSSAEDQGRENDILMISLVV
jgi:hypothetical protein